MRLNDFIKVNRKSSQELLESTRVIKIDLTEFIGDFVDSSGDVFIRPKGVYLKCNPKVNLLKSGLYIKNKNTGAMTNLNIFKTKDISQMLINDKEIPLCNKDGIMVCTGPSKRFLTTNLSTSSIIIKTMLEVIKLDFERSRFVVNASSPSNVLKYIDVDMVETLNPFLEPEDYVDFIYECSDSLIIHLDRIYPYIENRIVSVSTQGSIALIKVMGDAYAYNEALNREMLE